MRRLPVAFPPPPVPVPPVPPVPHSGVHQPHGSNRYFEGWYVRVCVPGVGPFAFMYSIEDGVEGCMQVFGLSSDELLLVRPRRAGFFPARRNYRAHAPLDMGQWFRVEDDGSGETLRGRRPRHLASRIFHAHVRTGYQLSTRHHQGVLHSEDVDASRSRANYVSSGVACAYDLRMTPRVSWARDGRSTATWLSRLQFFEPGYQVLLADATSTGVITDWRGRTHQVRDAPTYIEKNWGGAFPSRWFWLQCNAFDSVVTTMAGGAGGASEQLSLTSVGALRDICVPGAAERVLTRERIGMISFHWRGDLWEFAPWNCRVVRWDAGWGDWRVEAEGDVYRALLETSSEYDGAVVPGPTLHGLDFVVRDGSRGNMRLRVWRRRSGELVLDARSSVAAVETGGDMRDPEQRWTAERRRFNPLMRALVYAGEPPGRAVRV